MIKANFYRNNNKIYGFEITGHAGFAEEGEDIVCSAVTVLVINTINAIESFTDCHIICEADVEKGGFVNLELPEIKAGEESHDATLLLNTMYMGLTDIKKDYSKYITITDKEVL